MKQKFVLLILVIALVQLSGFAQERKKIPSYLPLVAEDGIASITASENIDVILFQDKPENVRVRVPDNVLNKLRISISGNSLFLSASKKLSEGERLTVYVWINELENLTLKGNAFAISTGVLNTRNLHISASSSATVSVKSKGQVWMDSPLNYQLVKENGYFYVSMSQ